MQITITMELLIIKYLKTWIVFRYKIANSEKENTEN